VLRNGSGRDYVIAGVGIGLAAATKYTGGVMAVCLVAAAVGDGAGGTPVKALRRLLLAAACALLAFVAANPYAVLDFSAFHAGVTTQQSLAGGSDPEKLGTTAASGTAF
jgi:4-amino-4-deoxy-L-arabinose transferase-like glycosyltransferase